MARKTKAEENYQEAIRRLTKAEMRKVKANVSTYLEKSILSLMGIERKYSNGYEIDHCNGRNSVLIDAFRELAIEEARKIASAYKPTKEELSVFEEAFKKELKRQFEYALRKSAEAKANQLVAEISERVTIDTKEILVEYFGELPPEKEEDEDYFEKLNKK